MAKTAKAPQQQFINKRIFDTDNAMKGTFNGLFGRWQLITYSFFVFGYALCIGWINGLLDFSLLGSGDAICANISEIVDPAIYSNYTNRSLIQRLSGEKKYKALVAGENRSVDLDYNYTANYGETVITRYAIFCELSGFAKLPRFVNVFGAIIGALILGFASDRGGRKIIILGCMWTTGIMSLFQLVGNDYISFVFFQFFLGLFIGGVQSSFLPAIIEMFPINFRAFYGVCFHLVVSLFQLLLPTLASSFKNWFILQMFVTIPLIVTAALQIFAYESIFWHLAHKEYDKAIQTLTKLAKRNGIDFESKFKQAKDFLHAKYSKGTQVDILPFLRLEDARELKDKYPQIDMTELQKKKANSSKLRFFLNSLKGKGYRSTNTIYRPFDFIYSPTLLVYVTILCGLWFTNGLTDSIEIDDVKKASNFEYYIEMTLSHLTFVVASILAVCLSVFKIGRRWMIFLAYVLVEICLLGSLIANFTYPKSDTETQVALVVLYHLCKFSAYFGLIFLMLITAEIFPTSLRCTGMGICTVMKLLGTLIASKNLLDYNSQMHRLAYCLLTLFFGSMSLLLPETKTFPLPRSILQIEAMPTPIGKKLRSRKAKMAFERRQNQFAGDTYKPLHSESRIEFSSPASFFNKGNNAQYANGADGAATPSTSAGAGSTQPSNSIKLNSLANKDQQVSSLSETNAAGSSKQKNPGSLLTGSDSPGTSGSTRPGQSSQADRRPDTDDDESTSGDHLQGQYHAYDTVTSVHDIEQDDHMYYKDHGEDEQSPMRLGFERKLTKILEVPSKNITRNNSMTDINDYANSKV